MSVADFIELLFIFTTVLSQRHMPCLW